MLLTIPNKEIYPSEVLELFQAFHDAGFFEESMLIGSWVMPLYQEAFGIPYVLRTLDIDFAVKFAESDRAKKTDLDKVITNLGYVPVMMQSGIRKLSFFTEQRVLPHLEMTDLRSDLFEKARRLMRGRTPQHPWADLVPEELLNIAGFVRKDVFTGKAGYDGDLQGPGGVQEPECPTRSRTD